MTGKRNFNESINRKRSAGKWSKQLFGQIKQQSCKKRVNLFHYVRMFLLKLNGTSSLKRTSKPFWRSGRFSFQSLQDILQICSRFFSASKSLVLRDYVPNDMRSLNINLKVVSLKIKLSTTIIHNEYDCGNNSRKGISNTSSIETNAFVICALLRSETLTCRH